MSISKWIPILGRMYDVGEFALTVLHTYTFGCEGQVPIATIEGWVSKEHQIPVGDEFFRRIKTSIRQWTIDNAHFKPHLTPNITEPIISIYAVSFRYAALKGYLFDAEHTRPQQIRTVVDSVDQEIESFYESFFHIERMRLQGLLPPKG